MKKPRLRTFQEFLDYYYWKDFDASGLSDEEYYELEDLWNDYVEWFDCYEGFEKEKEVNKDDA